MGDFNSILFSFEKSYGNLISFLKLQDFRDCVSDCGLTDLHRSRSSYTWSNQRIDYPIFSKIDRIPCNIAWLEHFPNLHYRVTIHLSSDHSSLIMSISKPYHSISQFKFKNHLVAYEAYKDLVMKAQSTFVHGDPLFILSKKIKSTKLALSPNIWESFSLSQLILSCKKE